MLFSMPDARTYTLDRSFFHCAVRIWNSLTDAAVGNICDDRVQAFKSRVHKHLSSLGGKSHASSEAIMKGTRMAMLGCWQVGLIPDFQEHL